MVVARRDGGHAAAGRQDGNGGEPAVAANGIPELAAGVQAPGPEAAIVLERERVGCAARDHRRRATAADELDLRESAIGRVGDLEGAGREAVRGRQVFTGSVQVSAARSTVAQVPPVPRRNGPKNAKLVMVVDEPAAPVSVTHRTGLVDPTRCEPTESSAGEAVEDLGRRLGEGGSASARTSARNAQADRATALRWVGMGWVAMALSEGASGPHARENVKRAGIRPSDSGFRGSGKRRPQRPPSLPATSMTAEALAGGDEPAQHRGEFRLGGVERGEPTTALDFIHVEGGTQERLDPLPDVQRQFHGRSAGTRGLYALVNGMENQKRPGALSRRAGG